MRYRRNSDTLYSARCGTWNENERQSDNSHSDPAGISSVGSLLPESGIAFEKVIRQIIILVVCQFEGEERSVL